MAELPTTAEGIYDLLAADEALVAMLGTYLFPDAEEPIPALAVLLPMEEHPEGTVSEGLEVVINRVPEGGDEPFMTGGGEVGGTFRLYVTQWTPGEGGAYQIEPALRRIRQLLPGAQWRDNTLPDGLGGLAQMAVTWEHPELETTWADEEEGEP